MNLHVAELARFVSLARRVVLSREECAGADHAGNGRSCGSRQDFVGYPRGASDGPPFLPGSKSMSSVSSGPFPRHSSIFRRAGGNSFE
jgi:hypothetical protein